MANPELNVFVLLLFIAFLPVVSPGGCMWIHLHPIQAPVHPSYACVHVCVVLLFTYSLSVCMFHYTVTVSNLYITCHVKLYSHISRLSKWNTGSI